MRRDSGFTPMEMVVGIAIMGMLLGISIPVALRRASRSVTRGHRTVTSIHSPAKANRAAPSASCATSRIRLSASSIMSR